MCLALAGAMGGLAAVTYVIDRPARERLAIREFVGDIERRLTHNAADPSKIAAVLAERAPEQDRRQLVADLALLARLDRLRFFGLQIEVTGDTGTAEYAIEATTPPGRTPAPRGGQFTFRRAEDRWALVGHRFRAGTAMPAGAPLAPRSRSDRPHVHRWTREPLVAGLAALSALALVVSVGLLFHSWRPQRPAHVARRQRW